MEAGAYLDFLHILEGMKNNTRHSWTGTGRHESVAEHSYRLSVMAFLLRDEFTGVDMERVLHMCLVHDWGEAVTGDIPSFLKTETDEQAEDDAVEGLLSKLPERAEELAGIFAELTALETPEAKVFKALDKLEAVIQHNEAPLDTWLSIERELNLVYGEQECGEFAFLKKMRALAREETEKKLAE